MLLSEKIAIIRKINNLTQEEFAEKMSVSRQAVSKWETGACIPDVQILIKIADFYSITLDQLVREENDLPLSKEDEIKLSQAEENDRIDINIDQYIGKVCDVSMNSLRYNAIRDVTIVGSCGNLICFTRKKKYGFFNYKMSLGILIKKQADEYVENNELKTGKCTVYANKGTYFGGETYLLSSIDKITDEGIIIRTGKFESTVTYDNISVILMKDKIRSK